MKHNLLRRIILAENFALFVISVVSTVLFLCGVSTGYAVFAITNYIFYPLILLTFVVSLLLKAVNFKAYKLNFVLFAANLAVSFICLLASLSKFAAVLQNF